MNLGNIKNNRKISKEAEARVLKDVGFQLGRVIERARTKKGKTQTELAREIGSTQSVIAKIESGSKLPSLSFLQRIADVFETHLIPPQFGFMVEYSTVVRVVDWHLLPDSHSYQAKGNVESPVKTLVTTKNYVA